MSQRSLALTFPPLPPMPEPARGELAARLLQSILHVFGAAVVTVLGKGSCFKGDFLPGYSDFDLHVFLDPARVPMLGPRAPALDRALAFQHAIGPIRADDYGVGAVQIYFVDAVHYPDDWAPPLPGTFFVLHGALPGSLPEPSPEAIRAQARAFFPWLHRDLRAHLHRIADKPDTRLAQTVRIFGTSVKPAVYHATVLRGAPPLEVWTEPLGKVLPWWSPPGARRAASAGSLTAPGAGPRSAATPSNSGRCSPPAGRRRKSYVTLPILAPSLKVLSKDSMCWSLTSIVTGQSSQKSLGPIG